MTNPTTQGTLDLPDGFAWDDAGERLLLDRVPVATVDGGRSWAIVTTMAMECAGRSRYMATIGGARRYAEAWARKWEAELRRQLRDRATAAAATYTAPKIEDGKVYPHIEVASRRQRKRLR